MVKSATPEPAGWLLRAALIVGAITAARIVLLALNRMDLFVDEAQYWLWGRELALGYYSKPPAVGWLIGAVTRLAGSDAAFWVRLPAPLLHAATALILGAIAARLFGARAAVLTAAAYVTLPMVALASILMSTDTVMFPFLALSLAGYLRLLDGETRALPALLTGAALGLAFLAKYAAVYYLLCAPLAAALIPSARPTLRQALLVLAAFVATILPNIVWNVLNGFSTIEHTLDNADWVRAPGSRATLNLRGLAEFLASQFAVIGPVLFGALLWLAATWRRRRPEVRLLLAFALPIIVIVSVQAVLSRAYANWAAAAYLSAMVAVVALLPRGWLIASFAVNGALSLALPLAGVFAPDLSIGDRLALARYIGRVEMSRAIIETARENGFDEIVASNRDILADLFHTGRDSGLRFYSVPPSGRPPNHYALNYPYPGATAGEVLFVADGTAPPPCAPDAAPLQTLSPAQGAYRNKTKTLFAVPAQCWSRP